MSSILTVKKALANWVQDVLGLAAGQVVWADQDGVKPVKPFVKLKMGAYQQIGWPVILDPDNAGHSVVVTQNDFTLYLQYFADSTREPIEELLKVQNSMWHEDRLGILREAFIAPRTVLMGPTDSNQVVDTGFEKRAAMDLLMSCPFTTSDTQQGRLTSADIEGALMNGSVSINQFEIDIDTPSIT